MPATLTRTDCHRPSVIEPTDYEFVGVESSRCEDIGDILLLQEERRRIERHMRRTGGDYSRHAHGGSCHVCGAHAIYTALFYHSPSNTYIRTGEDCADKLWSGDACDFRPVMNKLEAIRDASRTARHNRAGRLKAELLLTDAGLSRAWELYAADVESLDVGTYENQAAVCSCSHRSRFDLVGTVCPGCGEELTPYVYRSPTRDLYTLRDIVGRVCSSGQLTEPQGRYLGKLVGQIDNKAEREAEKAAAREAERLAAADCPSGRVQITGTVVSVKRVESQYGTTTKAIILADSGFRVFGTIPTAIMGEVLDGVRWDEYGERGWYPDGVEPVRVTFTATVTPSDTDCKFGFFQRPTKPATL